MSTDSEGRAVRRYTVCLKLEPGRRPVEYRVVTSLGELKAAAIAALRACSSDPDINFSVIEIVDVEDDYQIDPKSDLLDYWGGCD